MWSTVRGSEEWKRSKRRRRRRNQSHSQSQSQSESIFWYEGKLFLRIWTVRKVTDSSSWESNFYPARVARVALLPRCYASLSRVATTTAEIVNSEKLSGRECGRACFRLLTGYDYDSRENTEREWERKGGKGGAAAPLGWMGKGNEQRSTKKFPVVKALPPMWLPFFPPSSIRSIFFCFVLFFRPKKSRAEF